MLTLEESGGRRESPAGKRVQTWPDYGAFGREVRVSGSVGLARALLVLVAVVAEAGPAHAWVERTVKSDSVTVEVERDGTAVVTHEILLAVRGGPLAEIAVEPIDADAELATGATVTLAQSGHAAGLPLPLSAAKDGPRVAFRVVGEKGLRSGTHQIRFSYRTNLASLGLLRPSVAGTTLEWDGPSFPDGIDSARVVFRLPRGVTTPRLKSSESEGNAPDVGDEQAGVFLSTFRRTADKDELEVVRPHVAKSEIVRWRVTVDRAAFDLHAPTLAVPEPAAGPTVVAAPHGAPRAEPLRGPLPYVATLLSLAVAAVVALKSRWVAEACGERRATSRPLLPIPVLARALLVTAGLLGATALVVTSGPPLLAGGSLLVALIAATHLPPRISAPLRGPGKWVRLEPDVAFDDHGAVPRRPGRFVDTGSALGFVLFVALLVGFVAAAMVVMRHSTYEGIALALGSSVLFPIFCTGRAAELPQDAALAPRDLLDWLTAELDRDASVACHPLGRMPQGASRHDEIRLLALPTRPMLGFGAIEVGLDFHQGALGVLALPFVIVRVLEGSPAAGALPAGLLWTRGRTADERVAVLRPRIPTRRLTLALVRELAARLSLRKDQTLRSQLAPISVARSTGRSQATSKPSTAASPAHAT